MQQIERTVSLTHKREITTAYLLSRFLIKEKGQTHAHTG